MKFEVFLMLLLIVSVLTGLFVEGVKKNLPDTSWRGAYLMGVRLAGAISIPDSDVKTTQVRGINVKGFNSGSSDVCSSDLS
mgnify:CR=1 FL=1